MVRPRLLRNTSRTIAQVAVVHEKEAAIDLDLDLLRRRGKQVSEGGWGTSVEGRCCCAHRACLKGSEAGPVRERGREVMCEVLGRASQIGVSDTGWGSPSLIAVSWRPGAFAQPLWVWISS